MIKTALEATIFDSETTGMKDPVIVETAFQPVSLHHPEGGPTCVAVGMPIVDRWNPGKPIEFGAMATHFIEDQDLDSCPPISRFVFPAAIEYLIGHNIDYDWEAAGRPEVKRICTLAISRVLWPDTSHKLLALIYMLEPDTARALGRDAHSAGADVQLNACLLKHIFRMKPELTSWEALWRFSEECRIPKIMPFGKHKDVPLEKLPADYVRWALKNLNDIDPYLRKALEAL